MLGSDTLPNALARDHRTAALDERDIDRLRVAGFDDTGILDICQVVSYYNYVNRMAEGLGVELEEDWEPEDLTMTREEFEERARRRRQGTVQDG